jgi:hypothetical protein
MRDDETGLVEPDITINGAPLTFAQAMTMRVAVSGYAMLLDSPTMRQQLGALGDNYLAHLSAITRLMLQQEKKP